MPDADLTVSRGRCDCPRATPARGLVSGLFASYSSLRVCSPSSVCVLGLVLLVTALPSQAAARSLVGFCAPGPTHATGTVGIPSLVDTDSPLETRLFMTLDLPTPLLETRFGAPSGGSTEVPEQPGLWCASDGSDCQAHPLPPVPSPYSLMSDGVGGALASDQAPPFPTYLVKTGSCTPARGLAARDGANQELDRPPRG